MSLIALSRKRIWYLTLGFFLLLIALRLASSGTAALSFILLAAYALLGPRQVIHALLLTWFFLMMNSAIAPSLPAASLLRYFVLLCAATSVFMRSGFMHGRASISLLAFITCLLGIFIIVHSFVVSPEPIVSILKGASWMLAFLTSLSAWGALSMAERNKVEGEIFFILLLITVLSLLMVPVPQGYMVRGGGGLFKGALNHSQALGSALALLSAWVTAAFLKRANWLYLIYLFVIITLIVLTGSRTALLAGLLGVITALLLTPLLSSQGLLKVAPSLGSPKLWAWVFICFLGVFAAFEKISVDINEFINKGRSYTSVVLAYEDSRGGLLDIMMENINEYPISGIGFGIASDPKEMVVERFAGIPISAVIEKGVTPVAVLEELGIPGATLFVIWLGALIMNAARSSLMSLAVLCTILALNFGEATLFSPGGMGMLSIILIGWAVSIARGRRTEGIVQ